MSHVVDLMEEIATIDGSVAVKDLPLEAIESLADIVVWISYRRRLGVNVIHRFGSPTFCPPHANKGIVIDTGHPILDYEVKAIMLLMARTGTREGGQPYKWYTITTRIRRLANLARYAAKRGVRSFREFATMPEARLRTLLLGFVTGKKAEGALDAQAKTSLYKAAKDALKHLADFGLVATSEYRAILDEVTLEGIDRHVAENRLSHAIIPTGVMKQLIAEAVDYVDKAESMFAEFARVFRQTHGAFESSGCANVANVIFVCALKDEKALGKLLATYFADLQRHTYALVLAFTGMRDSEVAALRAGCAGYRQENSEDVFWLSSVLSKTDDHEITLDWVSNEPAYRAVKLLSRVNELYYERAELVLKHYRNRLPAGRIVKLEKGLAQRQLFGIRMTVATINFIEHIKSSDGFKGVRLDQYQIPVAATDIAQLEQMECNYRSVVESTGERGQPYVTGDLFNFTAHQFRHSFAWFIIANRLGDLDDIKYQFKHLHRAMTLIYAERGFKALNELRSLIEHFETFINGRAVDDIVASASSGLVAGGGGERLSRMIEALNHGQEGSAYGAEQQPHFKSAKEVVAFATRHSDAIRGLPHGYCTKGPSCKIKNAADPSHCLYCDTYFATRKHLPYWKAIQTNCTAKLARIDRMDKDNQQHFHAFRQSLEDNLFAATKIIARLAPSSAEPRETG